jgi:hypothetical protein
MPTLNAMYVGIDPGANGGLALTQGTVVIEWAEMPRLDRDLLNLLRQWKEEYEPEFCCLEKVNSMPGEGHVGAFSFGEGFGKLQMALAAVELPYELVTPRVWQKGLGVKVKEKSESKKDFKERLRHLAIQLFPSEPLWDKPKTLGKQRAVCDAMLIAEYCRRKCQGIIS